MSFDPNDYKLVPQRWFDDFKQGERFPGNSHTVTESHFTAFRGMTGDNHPIHYDIEYCKAHGHPGLLAHGLQVLAYTAAGAGLSPHAFGDALVAFIEVSARFLKGVYPGDTMYPLLEIVELKPQRTTGVIVMRATLHNQKGELVLEGTHRLLVKKRPAA